MDRASSFANLPTVDLRALTWCATAASPFFAWDIADAISVDSLLNGSIVQVAIDQVHLVVYLIVAAFGNVFVALGGALHLQRNATLFRPFSFTVTSLAIVGLLVALNAAILVLELLAADLYASRYESSDGLSIWQHALIALVLRNTALLAVVGVAARLYIAWRREPSDPKDGARVVALGSIGLAVALAYIAWRTILALSTSGGIVISDSLPITVLWWMQVLAVSIVDSLGTVFLVGSIAIALVRRAQVETQLGWVTMAALLGSLAYWLLMYGPSLAEAMPYIADPSFRWSQPHLRVLLSAIATGLIGGPVYLYVVNRDAFHEALASLPSSISALRSWPHRPSKDD